MITEVRLIRHAESEMNLKENLVGGRSNWALLSVEGIAQTRLLSEYLDGEGYNPDKIYATPAARTIQTAIGGMAYAGIQEDDLIIDPALQEQTHGDNEGLYRERIWTPEIKARADEEQLDFALYGGESLRQVGDRMFDDWLMPVLRSQMEARKIAAFAHGTAIRCLVAKIEEGRWDHARIRSTSIPNVSSTRIIYDRQTKMLHVAEVGVPTVTK